MYSYYLSLPGETPQHVKNIVGAGQLPVDLFDDEEEDQDDNNGFIDLHSNVAKAQADQLRKDEEQ